MFGTKLERAQASVSPVSEGMKAGFLFRYDRPGLKRSSCPVGPPFMTGRTIAVAKICGSLNSEAILIFHNAPNEHMNNGLWPRHIVDQNIVLRNKDQQGMVWGR